MEIPLVIEKLCYFKWADERFPPILLTPSDICLNKILTYIGPKRQKMLKTKILCPTKLTIRQNCLVLNDNMQVLL